MARMTFATDDRGGLVIDVVVSERNLWALLTKLYTPGSARQIESKDCPSEVALVRLKAEPDAVHYLSATRGLGQGFAGAMHPVTEAIMARVRPLIEDIVADLGPSSDR